MDKEWWRLFLTSLALFGGVLIAIGLFAWIVSLNAIVGLFLIVVMMAALAASLQRWG